MVVRGDRKRGISMSRNRLDNHCVCGRRLTLSDCVTRPLNINEYKKAIDWKGGDYPECDLWIGSKAICPECGRQYVMWLNNDSGVFPDTSFWHSFNDEPCDMCREQYR